MAERLTEDQRRQIRRLIDKERERLTIRRPRFTPTRDMERDTQGPDPWDTRVASGRSVLDAHDGRPLVS